MEVIKLMTESEFLQATLPTQDKENAESFYKRLGFKAQNDTWQVKVSDLKNTLYDATVKVVLVCSTGGVFEEMMRDMKGRTIFLDSIVRCHPIYTCLKAGFELVATPDDQGDSFAFKKEMTFSVSQVLAWVFQGEPRKFRAVDDDTKNMLVALLLTRAYYELMHVDAGNTFVHDFVHVEWEKNKDSALYDKVYAEYNDTLNDIDTMRKIGNVFINKRIFARNPAGEPWRDYDFMGGSIPFGELLTRNQLNKNKKLHHFHYKITQSNPVKYQIPREKKEERYGRYDYYFSSTLTMMRKGGTQTNDLPTLHKITHQQIAEKCPGQYFDEQEATEEATKFVFDYASYHDLQVYGKVYDKGLYVAVDM